MKTDSTVESSLVRMLTDEMFILRQLWGLMRAGTELQAAQDCRCDHLMRQGGWGWGAEEGDVTCHCCLTTGGKDQRRVRNSSSREDRTVSSTPSLKPPQTRKHLNTTGHHCKRRANRSTLQGSSILSYLMEQHKFNTSAPKITSKF